MIDSKDVTVGGEVFRIKRLSARKALFVQQIKTESPAGKTFAQREQESAGIDEMLLSVCSRVKTVEHNGTSQRIPEQLGSLDETSPNPDPLAFDIAKRRDLLGEVVKFSIYDPLVAALPPEKQKEWYRVQGRDESPTAA